MQKSDNIESALQQETLADLHESVDALAGQDQRSKIGRNTTESIEQLNPKQQLKQSILSHIASIQSDRKNIKKTQENMINAMHILETVEDNESLANAEKEIESFQA